MGEFCVKEELVESWGVLKLKGWLRTNWTDATEFREMKFDALDLGSSVAIRVGSSPTSPTIYVSAERRFSFWGRFSGLDPI